ncbi:MAG: hypothetical protein OER43_11320 [Gammaproteobacteria bacterium]|nr:hypothetical protein [Gammaproteobacteria bacterium]MDH3412065.1 hypothetical protein [Gammaproteobacteria bacterium]
MISRSLIGALALMAFSAPALAFHCPADIKAIDHALPKANLSAMQKEKVIMLRDEGEAQHKAGDHAASVKTLAEAMRIILNSM